jgi:hypothetical protein
MDSEESENLAFKEGFESRSGAPLPVVGIVKGNQHPTPGGSNAQQENTATYCNKLTGTKYQPMSDQLPLTLQVSSTQTIFNRPEEELPS